MRLVMMWRELYRTIIGGKPFRVRVDGWRVLLWLMLLVLLTGWPAAVQARWMAPASTFLQVAPTSPLLTPTVEAEGALSAAAQASPVSLALVSLVLAGVLVVVGLAIWRQR